jgi:hypothetical protein
VVEQLICNQPVASSNLVTSLVSLLGADRSITGRGASMFIMLSWLTLLVREKLIQPDQKFRGKMSICTEQTKILIGQNYSVEFQILFFR